MKDNSNTLFSFFWPIIKPYKWFYLMIVSAPIVSAFQPLIYSYSIKLLIDLFTKSTAITYMDAFKPILYFIGGNIIVEIAYRVADIGRWKSQPAVRENITCGIFEYVVGHSYAFFQNTMSGSIISKIKGINDGYYTMLYELSFNLNGHLMKTLVSGFCLMFANKDIFFITLIFTTILAPLAIHFFSKLGVLQKNMQNEYHNIIGIMGDSIANIFTLFAFSKRNNEREKMRSHYKNVMVPLQNSYFKLDFFVGIGATIVYTIFFSTIFLALIRLRNSGSIGNGDIAFILTMSVVFAEQIWYFLSDIKQFMQSIADLKSSFSILQLPHDTIDIPNATELKVSKGEIILQNVSFGYESNTVFENLNLHIKAGEKVGVVGHSGAGKSTLISLLLKNFKATTGDIIIDGQSIYNVTSDSIRSQISLIPQDIALFHRSIADNIGYAKDNCSQDEIERAAKMANIHELIETLPEKYKTFVGERGVKLSGGQRQRIAIARAMLKNAPILILDEATSGLDTETEQEVQKSINVMLKTNHATIIAIAHRLSTITHMDRIIVIEHGNIIEDGSFQELIAKENGKFKEMWDRQVNGMLV